MYRLRVLYVIGIVAALASAHLLTVPAPATAAEVERADKTLLGDWRFDEGGGDVASDSSGHGNDGEIHGADWVKGKFGTALHFGGRDAYVSIPGIASLDGSNELTAEAWVYWEKGGTVPQHHHRWNLVPRRVPVLRRRQRMLLQAGQAWQDATTSGQGLG